ncbi:MAG: type IV toxin-antitoxin system AbiEi family antitoxin domain-containing protein [Opitutales bacterium]|nr:type IV toxin-antitoxin system AbiEi family antitoxin domain-containing protein [Opitutales bacterium]
MARSGNGSIIKRLQTSAPRGRPLDSADLAQFGVSSDLAYFYAKSGWLERLARGTYMLAGDTLGRDGCLRFLADRMPGFHVGGRTALAWQGILHNVPAKETLTLLGPKNSRLPKWFSRRFPCRFTVRELFSKELPRDFGLQPLPESPDGPPVSVPERALLEMLSEVGVHQEIEEARHIMESARRLRADVLGPLLKACRQQKALRLCVGWAEELSLPWAAEARKAAQKQIGANRWVSRVKGGRTLILKP